MPQLPILDGWASNREESLHEQNATGAIACRVILARESCRRQAERDAAAQDQGGRHGSFRRLTRPQRHTFVAAFLGWTLDSLDFFILIFCVPAIAGEFHTKASAVMGAVFMTQAFRPVGALRLVVR